MRQSHTRMRARVYTRVRTRVYTSAHSRVHMDVHFKNASVNSNIPILQLTESYAPYYNYDNTSARVDTCTYILTHARDLV